MMFHGFCCAMIMTLTLGTIERLANFSLVNCLRLLCMLLHFGVHAFVLLLCYAAKVVRLFAYCSQAVKMWIPR